MSARATIRPLDVLDGFELPADLEARDTPEDRGLERDQVRLMVTAPDRVEHLSFSNIDDALNPGDLLVVNNSATLPAAVDIDTDLVAHFSTMLPGGLHVVEVRTKTGVGSSPRFDADPETFTFRDGTTLSLLAPFPIRSHVARLWVADLDIDGEFEEWLNAIGRPITYSHLRRRPGIGAFQTVFAAVPGSAEMPSAGRPFSERLVTRLTSKGIGIAPITLHTGVSSLESGEAPYPERFDVPESTASAINSAHARGARVIAVGTTVLRALQTVSDGATVGAGRGATDLVISPDTPIECVDGLITGWHEPESTHLDMLIAFAGRDLVSRGYAEALAEGYLWHEFGDSQLLLK